MECKELKVKHSTIQIYDALILKQLHFRHTPVILLDLTLKNQLLLSITRTCDIKIDYSCTYGIS
jgi:hypothetical protein